MTSDSQPPRSIIEQYDLDPESIQPLPGGLINRSFSARRFDNTECILQRVNAIFPAGINDDIDAVTRHLDKKGLTTPLLIPSRQGSHHVAIENEIWRLQTRIEGETHESVRDDADAAEAGRVLGSFHQALSDFDQPLVGGRPPVHNIERHLANLRRALKNHQQHSAQADVADIGKQLFAHAAKLAALPPAADHLVHGDPKISNILFNKNRAVCMIDLDTITRIPIAVELGDALRSWCNPAGEDSAEAHFSLQRFRSALQGYQLAAPDLLTEDELRAIPNTTLAIAIELSSRFAADALNESYFGWDSERFARASQHNLARARAQLMLAEEIEQQFPAMREFIVTLT